MFTFFTLFSFIVYSLGDQIYPIKSNSETQLENNGWIDCSTQEEVIPQNCQGDDLLWLECYVVPQNGLCTKQNINTKTQDMLNYVFTFYKTTLQTCDIEINGQSKTEIMNQKDDLNKAMFKYSGDNVKIKIKNYGTLFTGLTISKDCNPNCQRCLQSFCDQCYDDSFYYYNYRCSKLFCEQQINKLNSKSLLNSQGSYSDSVFTLEFLFNINLGDCLIPKVYYTYKIENSQIKYILQENQVFLKKDTSNTLIAQLPLKQIIENCQLINTTTAFVYQCYIGIAITSELSTQYLAVTISQLTIEKGTESTLPYVQSLNIPSDENVSIGPVFLVSETLSLQTDSNLKQLTVLQTISDPEFSNFRIHYYEAYLIQNNKTITLNLQIEIQQTINTTFIFTWTDPLFDPSQSFSFQINSEAKPVLNNRRRRLDIPLKRENLKVNYNAQNIQVYIPNTLIFDPSFKAGPLVGILVGAFAIIAIIITVAYYKYKPALKKPLI
ncbi:unnamed protein product [Paramecium sonneborni]|uniref:Transmembrane protein n=1 Tax=Paramecium sonneborni TaxID=65129 RepID=A0A8S1PUM5_9CILI|nr:unnamed protein product [Paramecium sonneborni]